MILVIETFDIHHPKREVVTYKITMPFYFSFVIIAGNIAAYSTNMLFKTLHKHINTKTNLVNVDMLQPSDIIRIKSWLKFLLVESFNGTLYHLNAPVDAPNAIEDILANLFRVHTILKVYLYESGNNYR